MIPMSLTESEANRVAEDPAGMALNQQQASHLLNLCLAPWMMAVLIKILKLMYRYHQLLNYLMNLHL